MNGKIVKFSKLIFSILICNSAGLAGSFFTSPAMDTWYINLNKPFFTPPGWVFPVVWTILYTLMGIALYWIWSRGLDRKDVKKGIGLFGAQLGMNFLWTVIFFGLRNPLFAFINIMILLGLIVLTTINFYRIDKKAGLILTPYIAWVCVATALNLAIVLLN